MLATERLDLVAWAPEHAGLLVRLAALPQVTRFIGAGTPLPRARAEEIHAAMLVHWRVHGFGWRAAVARASGRTVGLIALNRAGPDLPGLEPDEHEIGWWLDPADWGAGYATEGASAVRDEAFARLGAPHVVARIQPGNVASAKVAAAIGLEFAGSTTGRFGEPVDLHRMTAAAWHH